MKYQIVYDKPAVKFLNVSYTLIDMKAKEASLDVLTRMAGEIIEEAKA